ncbi:MAG: CotH kinase family protein [Pseudomonadota bacterium]|nr:CotH kinase family protein [Pseudomonadota bacterium]
MLRAVLSDAARATPEPDSRSDSPAWEAYYEPNSVHDVHVFLTELARDDLESDGRVWVPARVTIDGLEFPNAGVRRKGSTTWQGLSDKPSIKIKLREFGPGPRLAGLERITLNSMVSDPAQAREVISLRLWRALGVTATRASWARLWIDEVPYGAYANIEALDDEWLERRYDFPDGDLWEANNDADFTEEGLPFWELSEGLGDPAPMAELSDVLASGAPSFDEGVGHLVDVDHFLRYWAACLVTGATDGYPFHLNDAYVYADPGNGGRFDFVPWGMDESWGDTYSRYATGELARACEDDPICEEKLYAAIRATLTALDGIDVAGFVREAYAVSEPLVADDPRRPYTAGEVSAARAILESRILAWPGMVRADVGP